MRQPIKRAVQEWGVTMTLSFAVALVLVIVGTVLLAILPVGYFGSILIVLTVPGLVL